METEAKKATSSLMTAGQTKTPNVRPQTFRKEDDGGREEAERPVRKAGYKWQTTCVLGG